MDNLRYRLIGFGFTWMALWALIGSLMGYRLQEELVAGQHIWLDSLQRNLLRSTHAHMNSMAMVSIASGLAMPLLRRTLSVRKLAALSIALPLSIIVFGCGMVLETLWPPAAGNPSSGGIVTALGGSVFIIVMLALGVAALRAAFTKA